MSRNSEILAGLRGQNEPATFEGREGFWVQADCVFIEASCPQYAINRYRDQLSANSIACSHNHFCSSIIYGKSRQEKVLTSEPEAVASQP